MDENDRMVKDLRKLSSGELKDIPESVLQLFLEAAIKDAQKLFDNGLSGDFKQVTHAIYRAYILGTLFEKTSSVPKDNTKHEFTQEDNVIYMNFKTTR